MDLGHPITAVLPTLDGPVLEVLARTTRPLTGREVHRIAGTGSESGVRLVLNRLAGQGLVTATQAGKATLYVGNRDHIAWPAVDCLTSLRRTLFDRLRDTVEAWEEKALTVAVFGSAARGDGDTSSDIDILIIRQETEPKRWAAQVDALREQVTAWTGNTCQVYELTTTEYAQHVRAREPILAEWRRDAVVVAGIPLAQIDTTGAV